MKFSLAVLTFAAAALMGCSHSDSSPSSPALPKPSDKAATGAVNGQPGDFSAGTYHVELDANGKYQYWIDLGKTTCGISASMSGITVTAPAHPGTFTWPDATVQFYFVDASGAQTTMNGNSTINIKTDDGTTITGAVASVDGNSSVNGTFTATNCSPAPGQTNTPIPVPPSRGSDPASIQAIPASSLSQAHYAFCSAQGLEGVLIDFGTSDLSQGTAATFQYASRPCDASSPYSWRPQSTVYISRQGNQIVLDFGRSEIYQDQENTITFDPNSLTQGYAVWDGNSGPCTFMTNKGTMGLYDQDPGFECK